MQTEGNLDPIDMRNGERVFLMLPTNQPEWETLYICEQVSENPNDPSFMWNGLQDIGEFLSVRSILMLNRADACRLLVAIRGWLFATAQDAVKADCYCDDEITN